MMGKNKSIDKVYICPMPNPSDGYIGIAWAESNSVVTEEHIRKDALLKWAKEQLGNHAARLDNDPYKDAYYAKCKAFHEIIDKINSL